MARLTILLPAARDRCGRAVMVSRDGEVVLGPFRVLGTSSRYVSARMGNPGHDRTLPFGDPPCGDYAVASTLPPGAIHSRRPGRFGKLGALALAPIDGDEALAAKANGRERVVLHGGPRDHQRRLRRTRGGLRVGNKNLAALFDAINRVQAAGDPLSEISIVDVPAGFESEPALPAARRRKRRGVSKRGRKRGAPTASREGIPGVAVVAMAMFGVTKASPTRRGFLATALLAVAGSKLLTACASSDEPSACIRECKAEYGAGSGSGSGSGSASGSNIARGSAIGSGSGSGSGSNLLKDCIQVCEDDYGTGGGVG